MRTQLLSLAVLAGLLCSVLEADAQAGKKGDAQPGKKGKGGSFPRQDPNVLFEALAKGRTYFLISEAGARQEALTQWAESKGIAGGQINREQFIEFMAAQQGAAGDKKPAQETKGKFGDVDVHFLNGSTVRMQIKSEKLEIETPYGKLAVPMKDVRSIEFGSHLPEGHAAKIDAAIKKLGSSDFREREKAVAALIELGPFSYAAVVEATRAKEAEIAMRAKEIVQKLQAKHPKKDLKIFVEDKVITPTFPIVGRILTPSIKAKADYFGDVELNLADMRSLRSIAVAGVDVDVAVDAGKYAQRGQWLATNFQVDGRSAIIITAKGLIDLAPDDPGQFMSGPSGYGRAVPGGGGFGGGKVAKGAAAKNAAGLLVGKIGENGDTFVIGERYEGTPTQDGKLYLQINPSPYSPQSSGAYDVKAAFKGN